jgi:tetratricopeptide (TPR) repeat protein
MQGVDTLWKHYPNDAQLAAAIGALLDSTAHHKEATAWYQRSLSIKPGYEPALNNLALNYASLGKFSKAQPLVRQASQMDPANANLAYNLGLVCLRLNDYQEAADAFQRARQNTHVAASLNQLGLAEATARFYLSEYSETASLLKSIPQSGYQPLLLLGSAQALSGDLPAGIKTLQNAVALAPSDPQVYYRLALIFMLGRLNKEAQNVLTEGLKQVPRSSLLLYGMAVGCDAEGRWDEAVVWAKRCLDANPNQAVVWALLGSLYAEEAQNDDALMAYRQAMKLGSDAAVGVDLAQLLIRLQRFPEAAAELTELSNKYPNNARVDRGWGKLYREERKFDLAEKYLRQSIRLDPKDGPARFTLVEVLRLTHRTDEARKEFAIYSEQKQEREAKRLLVLAAAPASEEH